MKSYFAHILTVTYVDVGDGGREGPCPPPPLKIRKIYFSGNYYAKFGHFVNFSYVFFAQKMSFSLKLTELLRLWLHTRAFDSDVVQ